MELNKVNTNLTNKTYACYTYRSLKVYYILTYRFRLLTIVFRGLRGT
jgi:hypothetical protein